MYPNSTFDIFDQSAITTLTVESVQSKPLLMCTFTSDKGTEEYKLVEGSEFFEIYGNNISFVKHGQPLLQAAISINSGAQLLAKRIVAEDSTLANIAVVAEVSTSEVEGVNVVNIRYSTRYCTTSATVVEAANSILADINNETPDAGVTLFPLFTFSDSGRGLSSKRIQIQPNITSSKISTIAKYNVSVYENNESLEKFQFAFNPDIIEYGSSISLETMIKNNSRQVKVVQYTESTTNFLEYIGTALGMTGTELDGIDIMFGRQKDGKALSTINVDLDNGINLTDETGIALENGSNGSFGNQPTVADSYASRMALAYTGGYDNLIYDLDNYRIDAIVDANYPAVVKEAINELVCFREDIAYFRDMGPGLTSVDMITRAAENVPKNKFTGLYHNSYDVIDPYSMKQINVTIGYSICKILPTYLSNSLSKPIAGKLNGWVISDAIFGTLNMTPVVTPSVDEKETLSDARINYCGYYNGDLVVETMYTTQEEYTQLSFLQNVILIQYIVKIIRERCPSNRYGMMTDTDIDAYTADVQGLLDRHSNGFLSLTLKYGADATRVSNKQYYAIIEVQFKNFMQSEYFKVIALPS